MSHQEDNNRKGNHLQYNERIKIEIYHKEGYRVTEIAEESGRDRTTIIREIKLGLVDLTYSGGNVEYSAEVAQSKRNYASSNKGRGLKISNNISFANRIEELIKEGFSPYATLQFIRNNGEEYGVDICDLRDLFRRICGLLVGEDAMDRLNLLFRQRFLIATAMQIYF